MNQQQHSQDKYIIKKYEYLGKSSVQALYAEIQHLEKLLLTKDQQLESKLNNKIQTLTQKLNFLIILVLVILSLFNPLVAELLKALL